ncbi:MAG TPA: transposase, partial [Kofleriaceae bacterium]
MPAVGFFIVVKRVAQYEVVHTGVATVVPAPPPQTLFPKALLHTSTVAHLLTSKFALGVPHYRLERDQETELRRVLLDCNIPLDNTRAERALRTLVVGRKNWLFYGTDTHAEPRSSASSRPAASTTSTRSRTSTRSCASCRTGRTTATSSSRRRTGSPPARLDPLELDRPLSLITVPAPA